MTVLPLRWSRKRPLPYVSLGQDSTPLQRSAASRDLESEIWVKRDDLTGSLYGGNKVRKLERLLGDALDRGADTLVDGRRRLAPRARDVLYGKRVGLDDARRDGPPEALPRGSELAPTSRLAPSCTACRSTSRCRPR